MKVSAESTEKIVELTAHGPIPARVWEAMTDGGVECFLFVTRVMVRKGQDLSQFEAELNEQRVPTAEIQAIPLRLIL